MSQFTGCCAFVSAEIFALIKIPITNRMRHRVRERPARPKSFTLRVFIIKIFLRNHNIDELLKSQLLVFQKKLQMQGLQILRNEAKEKVYDRQFRVYGVPGFLLFLSLDGDDFTTIQINLYLKTTTYDIFILVKVVISM
jgi:hypothetical protein